MEIDLYAFWSQYYEDLSGLFYAATDAKVEEVLRIDVYIY
jgi:hypothetical protein